MKSMTKIWGPFLAVAALLFALAPPAAAEANERPALPVDITVAVDEGQPVPLEAYTIDGCDYVKLRDAAQALRTTRKGFTLAWDGASNELYLHSGTAYVAAGGELVPTEDKASKTAFPAAAKLYLDNQYHELDFTLYRIGGSHYLKLSDLAEALDFYMAGGAAGPIAIDTQAGYSVTGNKLYYSEGSRLWDEPLTGVKSAISADIDGDGEKESAHIVVGTGEEKTWTLVYQDGDIEASVPIFKGKENGWSIAVAAGHIVSEHAVDFLVAVNLASTTGRSDYELYSFKDGDFTKIDVKEITDGTEFGVNDVRVDENQKAVWISAGGVAVTVPISELELSDYRFYGQEIFCQELDFFIEMKLQSVAGRPLPDVVTTEMLAVALPRALTYLHTTYRYDDGAWQVQSVEFYDADLMSAPDRKKAAAD
jgi:hypothetical protein